MLSKVSEQVCDCLGHAEDCARKAAAQPEGSPLRQDFLDMEQRWRSLACSIENTERFTRFLEKAPSGSTPPKAQAEKHSIRCPRCQSPMTWFAAKLTDGGGSLQNSYQCDSCGFTDQTNDKPSQSAARSRNDGSTALQLHEISTLLIQEGNLDSLYNRILEAAIGLMSSDMASMQLLDPQRDHLRLLGWKGFHPQSAAFWQSVHFNSASTCGLALATGSRVVVPDIETCDSMAGTADLDEYRRSNIRAVQSTPLVSRSGQLLGMISTHWREPHQPTERALWRLDVLARQAADLIERTRTEAALRERNDQLGWYASVVENSDDAIITKDLDGIIKSWNKGAERVFGYTADEVVGKPITILIPPERLDEEPAILGRIKRGERTDHYETVRQRKDGSLINISLTVSPVKNAEGKIVGASKIARDITDRKRSDEHVATLAREAEHRTKNILATVQATVKLSQSKTPDDLKRVIEGRIQALTNVHALFVESRWKGAELSTLAQRELAPYLHDNEAHVHVDGPELLLEPNIAQTIALILHELATNAAKYGALSVAKGRVEIKWSVVASDQLILTWTEQGGPAVKKPTRQGFGTRVMERMIRDQHKGDLRLDWSAEGLVCAIILPMCPGYGPID